MTSLLQRRFMFVVFAAAFVCSAAADPSLFQAPTTDAGRALVEYYVARFTSGERREWLSDSLYRLNVFRTHVEREVETAALPKELIYLPVLESGYNPRAVSRSGASGLWQFMLNSIGPYDLTISEWLDERRDFWKATTASLHKLSFNYRAFGDWNLALAAYNCGYTCMKRALQSAPGSSFWDLAESDSLPIESRRYVPKFLALIKICDDPAAYGITLPSVPKIEWTRIEVPFPVHVRRVAEHASVPYELLQLGNAELSFGVTPPGDGGYLLKVPIADADAVSKAIRAENQKAQEFLVHTVRKGDTLYAIARKNGVEPAFVQAFNPDIRPRFLAIGSRVIVPLERRTAYAAP